jgi:hypothetical protein
MAQNFSDAALFRLIFSACVGAEVAGVQAEEKTQPIMLSIDHINSKRTARHGAAGSAIMRSRGNNVDSAVVNLAVIRS